MRPEVKIIFTMGEWCRLSFLKSQPRPFSRFRGTKTFSQRSFPGSYFGATPFYLDCGYVKFGWLSPAFLYFLVPFVLTILHMLFSFSVVANRAIEGSLKDSLAYAG